MKLDLSKEPRRLPGYNRSDLIGRMKPVVPTAADWLAMMKALSIHMDLYVAGTGLDPWRAVEQITRKLDTFAASVPDAIAVVERERARQDAARDAQMLALGHRRPERRKAVADRRASA